MQSANKLNNDPATGTMRQRQRQLRLRHRGLPACYETDSSSTDGRRAQPPPLPPRHSAPTCRSLSHQDEPVELDRIDEGGAGEEEEEEDDYFGGNLQLEASSGRIRRRMSGIYQDYYAFILISAAQVGFAIMVSASTDSSGILSQLMR